MEDKLKVEDPKKAPQKVRISAVVKRFKGDLGRLIEEGYIDAVEGKRLQEMASKIVQKYIAKEFGL